MTPISMNFAGIIAISLCSFASLAKAGQNKMNAPACYEGSSQGKAAAAAKTQEECKKLGEKFVWVETPVAEHDHKSHAGKAKNKMKQNAHTEAKAVETNMTTEAAPVTQPTASAGSSAEAPKK